MRNQGHIKMPISRWLMGLLLLMLLSACGRSEQAEEVPTQDTVVPFGVEGDNEVPTAVAITIPTEQPTIVRSVAVPTVAAIPTESATALPPTALAPTEVPATELPATVATASQPALPASQGGDLYTVVSVTNDDLLNVRAGVGVENALVGTIPPAGMGIQLLGEGQTAGDGTLWLPIQYQEVRGWVNSIYLARQVGSVEAEVALKANEIILALQEKQLEASAAHPVKGVYFSPYTFVIVNPDSPENQDLVFSAAQIGTLFADPTIYEWGSFDGSGEPIKMTFAEYFDRFVYDADFARPQVVGYNEFVGEGSMINNIREVYPDALVVEYHFEGIKPEYGGLDWRSLRLVLEEQDGEWYLVGIVHSEWTT